MAQPQQPIRSEGGRHDDYKEDHPAYALVGASRSSSHPGTYLTGSDFRHQHFVVISIQRARLSRGLSSDHFHGTGEPEIVNVALSEAQWATFVSTLNMGAGVPATLTRVAGVEVPSIAPITDRREQHRQEIGDTLNDALAHLDAIIGSSAPKATRNHAAMAKQELLANLPFVAKRFDEHAEETVEKAKIEVEAYLTSAVQRAGLQALGGKPMLELTDGDPEPNRDWEGEYLATTERELDARSDG